MRMKKYEITDIAHPDNPKLHRIRALTDVGTDVHKGDLGGFVETEDGKATAIKPTFPKWLRRLASLMTAVRMTDLPISVTG